MKAVKLAGIRLVNYINDGINWKDHKDIILDFWIAFKCKESGYYPNNFKNMFTVEELPVEAQQAYETWFKSYNFLSEDDKNWIEFVDGTLNIFYHTKNPTIMDDNVWYVELMKSEVKAREICETQVYHGNPNINAFWKIETNSKPEEVGGRRNGYMFTRELTDISPNDTKGYYWAVAFQCPETVKLYYNDKEGLKSKCINWAANASHMTLLKITSGGRFLIEQIFVEGKAWRRDRYIPQSDVPRNPMTGGALNKYIIQNYYDMYGVWDEIDEEIKAEKESSNQRKNAINTFNDEEVKVGEVIDNVEKFITDGNVPANRRERNKQIRQAIREKNKIREREIRKKIREIEKSKRKQRKIDGKKFSAFK